MIKLKKKQKSNFLIYSDDKFSLEIKKLLACQICKEFTLEIKQCNKCEDIICNKCKIGTIDFRMCPGSELECHEYSEPNIIIKRLLDILQIACKKCIKVFSVKELKTHSNCSSEEDEKSEIHLIDILIEKNRQLQKETENIFKSLENFKDIESRYNVLKVKNSLLHKKTNKIEEIESKLIS